MAASLQSSNLAGTCGELVCHAFLLVEMMQPGHHQRGVPNITAATKRNVAAMNRLWVRIFNSLVTSPTISLDLRSSSVIVRFGRFRLPQSYLRPRRGPFFAKPVGPRRFSRPALQTRQYPNARPLQSSIIFPASGTVASRPGFHPRWRSS
jgi:hypothetical protein